MSKRQLIKTKAMDLFYPGLADAPYYRIPILIKTSKGNLIAGADQRNTTELDWGKINPVFRFNEDDGFTDPIKIIEMDSTGTDEPPFNIDICLVEKTKGTNRLYMLIDAFKSGGNYWASEPGTGYQTIGDKAYLEIFAGKDEYLVDNNGYVFTNKIEKTNMRVVFDSQMPFRTYGDIYKGGQKIGNIYKDNSPYQVHQTSFLWLLESDDDGKTWQDLIDITPQVADRDMKFIGTGPGRGLELANGRLVFPIYYSVFDKDYEVKQNTAVVYTDDGKNFSRSMSVNDTKEFDALAGEHPINTSEAQLFQRTNGDVWIFFRNDSGKVRYAVSKDNCETFGEQMEVDFKSESYCMLSVVYLREDSKEYILLSNPKGPDRTNGSIKLMEILGEDKIKTLKEFKINTKAYTYSCLEQISNDKFALLYEELNDYEGEARQHLKYLEFTLE